MRIGSFNFGIQQDMIKSKKWKNHWKDLFSEVANAVIADGALHVLFGCEAGGRKAGLSNDALEEVSALASGAFRAKTTQNYLSAFACRSLCPGVSLESGRPTCSLAICTSEPHRVARRQR